MKIVYDTDTAPSESPNLIRGDTQSECDRLLGLRFMRLIRLQELNAPEIIVKNEQAMIATAVSDLRKFSK